MNVFKKHIKVLLSFIANQFLLFSWFIHKKIEPGELDLITFYRRVNYHSMTGKMKHFPPAIIKEGQENNWEQHQLYTLGAICDIDSVCCKALRQLKEEKN